MNIDTGIIERGVGNMQLSSERLSDTISDIGAQEIAMQNERQRRIDAVEAKKQRDIEFTSKHMKDVQDIAMGDISLRSTKMNKLAAIYEEVKTPEDYERFKATARLPFYGIQVPEEFNLTHKVQFIAEAKGLEGKLNELKTQSKPGVGEDLGEQQMRLMGEFKNNPSIMTIAKNIAEYKTPIQSAKIPGFGKDNKMANMAMRGLVMELNPNYNETEFDINKKMITPSGTSGYGMLNNKLIRANEAKALLEKDESGKWNVSPANYTELAMAIAGMVSGSNVMAEGIVNEMRQKNLLGDIAHIGYYFGFTDNVNAAPQAVLEKMAQTIDRTAEQASIMKKSYEGKLPISTKGPQYSPIIEKKQTKELSAQDREAIDWAKKNPNDPRAKEILKLHGM